MSPSRSGSDPLLSAIVNPFTDSAVGSVWDPATVDVRDIHADVFERLLQTVEERTQGHRHKCLVLYGDAGSGKTHVLRRLRLALEDRTGPWIPFSWIRMQTSPSMVWRHLRRHLIDNLTRRPVDGGPQLERLQPLRSTDLDNLADPYVSIVLKHFLKGHHKLYARAWLAGSAVPDNVLESMGLSATEADEETLEAESHQVLVSLAQFVAPQPIVLCLDQLEALQSHPGDRNGLFAIGKLLAALHDDTPNAVVIGCIQTGLMGEMDTVLSKAERDRYTEMSLRPLTPEEARSLVGARLATEPQISARRPRGESEYWPIDMSRFDSLLASPQGLSARRLIHECERMFLLAQGLPTIELPLENHLEKEHEGRVAQATEEISPDTSANVLSDGLPRLLHLQGCEIHRQGIPGWLDHICKMPNGTETGVMLGNGSATSLARRLQKVLHEWDPAAYGLVIVRDALNPLRRTARVCHQRLAELTKRGARLAVPTHEAMIALDALRRLLADAESGDLAFRGEAVPVPDVEEWVRHQMPESTANLLDLIRQEVVVAPPNLLLDLGAYLAEAKLTTVTAAATALNADPNEVERCATENPGHFGILGGTETVVFQRIPESGGASNYSASTS